MWRNLLTSQVEAHGLRAVAEHLGYSRTTLSLVLNGKYNADTRRIEERVLAVFGTVSCPFEDRDLEAAACSAWCRRIVPTSSAWALRHWAACRTCPYNPTPKENP